MQNPAFQLTPATGSLMDLIEQGGIYSIGAYGDWTVFDKNGFLAGMLVQAGVVTDAFPPNATLHQAVMYAQRWSAICQILKRSREKVEASWFNKPTRSSGNPGAGPQKNLWLPQPQNPAAYAMTLHESPELGEGKGVFFAHGFGFHCVWPGNSGFTGKIVLHNLVCQGFSNETIETAKGYLAKWQVARTNYVESMKFVAQHLETHRFQQLISLRQPESRLPQDFSPVHVFENADDILEQSVESHLKAGASIAASLPHGAWRVWHIEQQIHGELSQYRATTDRFENLDITGAIARILEWTRAAHHGDLPKAVE